MSSNEIIERLVIEVSSDPLSPVKNFNAAVEYEKLHQSASAVGFYLRAVEYGFETQPLIAYASLLRISICMEGQKDRNWTVSNTLLQAVAFLPTRPEAYFLLSRFYEKSAQWQESYTYACLGQVYSKQRFEDLPVEVDYIGDLGLLFQRAVSAWWVGRKDESTNTLLVLAANPSLPFNYKQAVSDNLSRLGIL
jgi:hypothetical protein